MTRALALAVALSLALLAAVGAGWWGLSQRDRARAAEAEVAGWREAARVHREVAARLAAEAAEARAIEDDVSAREGGDAPASDYLRGIRRDLDRLR